MTPRMMGLESQQETVTLGTGKEPPNPQQITSGGEGSDQIQGGAGWACDSSPGGWGLS